MKFIGRVKSSVLCLVLGLLILTSCKPESDHTASIDAFMKIEPGISSQEDILVLLGKPDEIEDGVLSLYWDYFSSENKDVLLRVFFDEATMLVSMIELYDKSISVEDVLDRFGESPIVFQVDGSEEITGDYSYVWFGYPEIGVRAEIHNKWPHRTDFIFSLARSEPRNRDDFIVKMESHPRVRFIDWP